MQAWRGWTTTATARAAITAPLTLAEWCARQQRLLRDEQRRQQGERGLPFTARVLARLSFVRWLWQTGRLDLRERDTA